ncbi:MAG TPA: ADP-ribosylglycohydrolase family protein [Anaerolineae bacterium]|nr:ADP-ribosylglycohydrolase family protein [Anaerolineae bacterium]
MSPDKRERTLQSLAGLSVGDAFGEQFFTLPPLTITYRRIPEGPWAWTDDTHMALSIVEVMLTHGYINQDELARLFAFRFGQEPWRGYASGAQRLLTLYTQGADWRKEAPRLFRGGSYGNGGAMRAAPIGAYFTSDPERAAVEARRSAAVTHAHPEGQAGAMAVAAAAAIVSSPIQPIGTALLREVLFYVPASRTREGIVEATRIDPDEHQRAIAVLGTGNQVAAFDTVPYCLWVVAYHAPDFETALWTTVAGLGDRDTTCAIVGGIVAISTTIPAEWLERREPLPEGFEV